MKQSVSYKRDGIEVSVTGIRDSISPHKGLDIAIEAWGKANSVREDVKQIKVIEGLNREPVMPAPINMESVKNSTLFPILENAKQDDPTRVVPLVRKRIPNNVIDPSTLSYKKAMTENALIRCPACGQAHAAIVHDGKDWYLLRKNYEKGSFDIVDKYNEDVSENIDKYCCKKDDVASKRMFFDDIQKSKINPEYADSDLVIENTSKFICPVCKDQALFIDWKVANDSPLDFFESENLCDICGGELVVTDFSKDNTTKCDKCHEKFVNGKPERLKGGKK